MSQRSRMERRSRQFPHGLRHGQNDVCDKTIGDLPSWFFAVFDGIGEASDPKHCPLRLPNPKGIASFSPGLRGTSYPGKTAKRIANPNGVGSIPLGFVTKFPRDSRNAPPETARKLLFPPNLLPIRRLRLSFGFLASFCTKKRGLIWFNLL